jgi:hypothetical protein
MTGVAVDLPQESFICLVAANGENMLMKVGHNEDLGVGDPID